MRLLQWLDTQILSTTRRVFNNPLLVFGLMALFALLKVYFSRERDGV
ncbi:MAG: hypothetical protein L0G70_10265 [Rubrobacter sp.]|nr:hypothetical protein [Rubrobacter sp.]